MEEKESVKTNKTLLQRNASWPLLVVYLAFLIGIFYTHQAVYSFVGLTINSTAYLLVTIIIGIIASVLFYNLGKLIFAKVNNYQIIYFTFLGIIVERGAVKKTHYDITRFFDIAMQFAPADDNTEKNPRPIFLGGLAGFALFAIIALVLFLLFQSGTTFEKAIAWASLFALIYGFVIVLYEFLPFKQDAATDIYNLIMTRSKEDRVAFNIMQINAKREFSGEEYIYPEFTSYESYYKAQTLYYHYLDLLYKNELEEAVKTLTLMASLENYLPDDQKYLHTAESVYLRYLIKDDAGAESLYRTLKSDDRKYVRQPIMLSGYRTALLVLGKISGDAEAVNELIKDYKKTIADLECSGRVESENKLFTQAYGFLLDTKPELNLAPLTIEPTETNKTEAE